MSELVGKTVKSNQEYWYEVHETDADGHELQLVPVDSVPAQYVSSEELEERMANGWELVYDGVTGTLGDEQSEPRLSVERGEETTTTCADGGRR
jgi:hypothetical protein